MTGTKRGSPASLRQLKGKHYHASSRQEANLVRIYGPDSLPKKKKAV